MIRRLTATDKELLTEVYLWDKSYPKWFREMDNVWGPHTVKDFIGQADHPDNMFIGIFDDTKLIGLASHIFCPRDVDQELLLWNLMDLRDQLFRDLNIESIYCWVARKHYALRKLCSILGFRETGHTLIKGSYHGRVIEWVNLSIPREIAIAKAA